MIFLWVILFSEDERADFLKRLEGVMESCVVNQHSVALARKAAQEIEAQAVSENNGHPDVNTFDEVRTCHFQY